WIQDTQLTFADALARAQNAAGMLAGLGLGAGDTLAVMLPNGLDFLDLWLGTTLLGAVLVPVNTALRGDGLRYIVEHCDARIGVVDAPLREAWEAALPAGCGPQQLLLAGDGVVDGRFALLTPLLAERHPAAPRADVAPGDLAAVLYTSGTTGLPKGVMTCHNAYAAAGLEYAQRYVRLREDDRLWTCLPLFHINAQSITVMPSLLSGRPAVMSAKFSASGFLDEMRRHQATVFNYMGVMITILLKQPVREDDADNPVRITAGSAAPAQLWREFEQRFGIQLVEIYGLTETAGVCLASPPDDVRIGRCGIPVSWAQVEIQREDGTTCDPGEPGEFVCRTDQANTMFLGYFKNPEATEGALRDGWFHSGDRGRRDEDGYFEFIDRLKDCIRRRGENISSYEIERTVNAHPHVAETAAVGVPSELGEEEVMVVVVPREGHALDPEDLIAHCAERMAAFMVPRYVRIVESLPKTPTEKIQKFELREQGAAGAWERPA
ncbi:MAG: AMP-binding protein, partial [Actinobacteria bacterium]|nr:AMP-binding protein [Actinomycetota bacterium]